MRTDTTILIKAMRILAEHIESPDGVANGAILEASYRLEELYELSKELNRVLELAVKYHGVIKPTAKGIECWDYYKVQEQAEAVLNKAEELL